MEDHIDINALLDKMAHDTQALLAQRSIKNPVIVGIHTGGVWLAEHLHRSLALTTEVGQLDISFYRDDFTRIGMNPQVKPCHLPFSVDDQHIILVDDVLYTGRTIRAALNELFDYGRPASIMLIVLIDRNGHELPIQADVRGMHINLAKHEHIKLQGPEPLLLAVTKNA